MPSADREPLVSPDRIVAALVAPPTFREVSFDSYRPDLDEPSQQDAVDAVRDFAANVEPVRRPRRWHRLGRRSGRRTESTSGPTGLYLDGGFGVGKTHLLAALWHGVDGPKLFATFVELTHLVGALGFAEAVARLSTYRLVCIDEFELDDPGDTVLVSTLLARLSERGVKLAATSNTLPGRLGAGRFAAEDFLREIQALADRFIVVRIDGPDYRHRELAQAAPAYDDPALDMLAQAHDHASKDHFVDLCRHLATIHPRGSARCSIGCGWSVWSSCASSTTRRSPCGWWCSRTASTTAASPSPSAAGRSTRCSGSRCWRVGSARSTCAP